MRIAIVINTSWNIFNFRKGLVKKFLKEGHNVIAIAPKDEYSEKLKSWGCEYLPLEMDNKGTNPIKDFFLILQLKRLYKQANADVYLQYTIKPNIYGSIAAKMIGKPTICNVSGLGTIFINPNKLSSKIGMFLYKYAFRFPKKVFFQNHDDEKLFVDKKLLKENITDVLPGSGVDLQHFKSETPFKRNQPFTFLMISRLLVDKGVMEYFEAAKIISSKNKDVQFQILGKIDDSKGSVSIEELKKYTNKGFIHHLGETDDVKSAIEKADCVVLPSYREGTPRTLLESLAMSKPIVTTDVPGCKETVINQKNGYLCEVKSVESLVNKIQKVINLPDSSLKKMGIEGRKLAESKFDEQIVINQYLKTVNEICKA